MEKLLKVITLFAGSMGHLINAMKSSCILIYKVSVNAKCFKVCPNTEGPLT
jgi:hypothetical protein